MLTRLMNAIRTALWPRWNSRLPEVNAAAKAVAADVGAEEAYRMGYRTAYWDAVVDMVEADLLRTPGETFLPRLLAPQVSDEVH